MWFEVWKVTENSEKFFDGAETLEEAKAIKAREEDASASAGEFEVRDSEGFVVA